MLILLTKFLMNENLAFKKPEGVTTEQAATIGAGLLVRSEYVFDTKVKLTWGRLQLWE